MFENADKKNFYPVGWKSFPIEYRVICVIDLYTSSLSCFGLFMS